MFYSEKIEYNIIVSSAVRAFSIDNSTKTKLFEQHVSSSVNNIFVSSMNL